MTIRRMENIVICLALVTVIALVALIGVVLHEFQVQAARSNKHFDFIVCVHSVPPDDLTQALVDSCLKAAEGGA